MRRWSVLAVLVVLGGCGDSQSTSVPTAGHGFDARRALADVRAQVAIGPRPAGSPEGRLEARFIAANLRRAGLQGVRVQGPYLNVVGSIPGSDPGAIVLGAHHDTKQIPGFVGANDGASEVAVLLELARDLPNPASGPSIHLAFFDAEESRGPSNTAAAFARSGDRGSAQYVRYAQDGGRQGSPAVASIEAMVLFDMVGDCDLEIPREASSDAALYALFVAAAGSRGPFLGEAGGILDDHTPFQQAGIPALDLIDFDYGPGPPPGAWWHTRDDDLSHVCATSLDAVGEAALLAIPRIGE